MIIGIFSYDHEHDTYTGHIRTLTLQRAVALRPTARAGEREPDYRIFEEGEGGTVEFGAAWKRTSERGQEFLSIVIDDPALNAPLHAALFMRERENSANLVWTRPSTKPKAPTPERRANSRRRSPGSPAAEPA